MNALSDIIINTCYATTSVSRNIAFYSHLIPVFFSLLLAFLVFLKAKRSILSKIFLAFSLTFSLWLIGDLITWTSNNYYLVYATWSFLDYIEIIFFVLGFYFVSVFISGEDLPFRNKILIFFATLIPFLITISEKSVMGFNYPVCEAFNNDFLGQYKLYLEILIIGIIFFYMLVPFLKKTSQITKTSSFIVTGSMFLFLSVFSITEYLASTTGYYELNLYALFVIPVFLIAITYSIYNLDIFNLKIVSTYFLVFGFLILIASQIFFVTNSGGKLLTILTLILSTFLSFMLFKNLHKEVEQRTHIEKLNTDLEKLLNQRESLVHLVTHKVKGSFTRSKYIFAEILDGTFGDVNDEVKRRAKQGLDSDNTGIQTIDLVLNAANLQKDAVKYEMKVIDLKKLILETLGDKKGQAEVKGLLMEINLGNEEDIYSILGDVFWLKEAINNLIDNSIKYTREGKITIKLEHDNDKVKLTVKDTGVGITEEDKKNLFTEGGRGKDSLKMNVDSTGYGLFTSKLIIQAHKGTISAESEGEGKGSTFTMKLPVATEK